MNDLLQFAIDRYNYWVVILLMMIGLYIVISRGNLVKKIVGLNIFQTSVFIFYISIGKVSGGTAPILIGKDAYGHGDGGEEGIYAPAIDGSDAAATTSLHAAPASLPDAPSANELASSPPGVAPETVAGLHAAPSASDALASPPPGFDAANAADAVEGAYKAAEIIYSNPLPHVLILTAIVVGVATTAVGLALAVRIREAYGAIEEDELEAADDIAEFGHDFSKTNPAGAGA